MKESDKQNSNFNKEELKEIEELINENYPEMKLDYKKLEDALELFDLPISLS